jgi:PadR family transcriptional regulator PadR
LEQAREGYPCRKISSSRFFFPGSKEDKREFQPSGAPEAGAVIRAIHRGADMVRDIDLAFIKVHILYHAAREEVFGIGLMEELARHGYDIGPGTLYPTLFKMEELGLLSCEPRTVNQKQRKYYRITPAGRKLMKEMKNKIKELYEEVVEGN